jgi:hypothetical protein
MWPLLTLASSELLYLLRGNKRRRGDAKRCEPMRDSSRHGRALLGTKKAPLRLLFCNRGSVFRSYSSCMAWISHTSPSLRLFVPNSLTVCHVSFFPYSELAISVIGVTFLLIARFLPRWSFSKRYIRSLLKCARPERHPDKLRAGPGVLPSSST